MFLLSFLNNQRNQSIPNIRTKKNSVINIEKVVALALNKNQLPKKANFQVLIIYIIIYANANHSKPSPDVFESNNPNHHTEYIIIVSKKSYYEGLLRPKT